MPTEWYDQPLRDGEFDVPVMFRVTAASAEDAREKVANIIRRDRFESTIVPMYLAPRTEGA